MHRLKETHTKWVKTLRNLKNINRIMLSNLPQGISARAEEVSNQLPHSIPCLKWMRNEQYQHEGCLKCQPQGPKVEIEVQYKMLVDRC